MIPTYRHCLLRSLFGGAEHLAICGLPPPQRCYLFLLALAALTASERGGGGTLCEVSGKDYMWQIWRGENQEKTNRQLNARECLGAQMGGRRGGDKCRWRGHDRRAAMAAAPDLRTRRPTGGLATGHDSTATQQRLWGELTGSERLCVCLGVGGVGGGSPSPAAPLLYTHTHTAFPLEALWCSPPSTQQSPLVLIKLWFHRVTPDARYGAIRAVTEGWGVPETLAAARGHWQRNISFWHAHKQATFVPEQSHKRGRISKVSSDRWWFLSSSSSSSSFFSRGTYGCAPSPVCDREKGILCFYFRTVTRHDCSVQNTGVKWEKKGGIV